MRIVDLIACCLLLLVSFLFIRINLTKSVPYTVFWLQKVDRPHIGEYIAFSHPKNGEKMVKQYIARGGEKIEFFGNRIIVAGEDRGEILERSQSGNIYTPIQFDKVPEGFVFVWGSHKESFDSRYEEFGFIPEENILEVLWPIF